MARMHSRKHGKSRSRRPSRKGAPKWVTYKPEEVEKLIVKMAKDGHGSAKVGLTLRDQYGIPNVKELMGKSVTTVFKENKIQSEIPEDLFNLMKRAVRISDHLVTHKHDPFAIHGLELTESKIRRLGKYYISKGVLPSNWKYNRERTKLLVK